MRADINESPRPAELTVEQSETPGNSARSIRQLSHLQQGQGYYSASPTVLLRISDDSCQMNRAFSDYSQAVLAAEAYAGAGFVVVMVSATGHFLMRFRPRWQAIAV